MKNSEIMLSVIEANVTRLRNTLITKIEDKARTIDCSILTESEIRAAAVDLFNAEIAATLSDRLTNKIPILARF